MHILSTVQDIEAQILLGEGSSEGRGERGMTEGKGIEERGREREKGEGGEREEREVVWMKMNCEYRQSGKTWCLWLRVTSHLKQVTNAREP